MSSWSGGLLEQCYAMFKVLSRLYIYCHAGLCLAAIVTCSPIYSLFLPSPSPPPHNRLLYPCWQPSATPLQWHLHSAAPARLLLQPYSCYCHADHCWALCSACQPTTLQLPLLLLRLPLLCGIDLYSSDMGQEQFLTATF